MQENIVLKNLTTMQVGGKARFFVSIRSEKELGEAVAFAQQRSLDIFVLGGGSNVVISDSGFDGLVIKNEIRGIGFFEKEEVVEVEVSAGENWDDFVRETVERGLYGLENLSLIPGNVGAAPVQNIGAYGVEVKDTIILVRAFDVQTQKFREFKNQECDFSYRNSFFKNNKNLIITSVVFALSKKKKLNLSYKDILREAEDRKISLEDLSARTMREIIIAIRQRKLPDPKIIPTAGSFFKNPEISKAEFKSLQKDFIGIPSFQLENGKVKIPLAWIIEHVCQMKGEKVGGAAVFENHALVLVNENNALAEDVFTLAKEVERKVFEKTKIRIEAEVQFVGEF